MEAKQEDLNSYFEEHLINEYKAQYEVNDNQHFSNQEELNEFFNDGITILQYLKTNASTYFEKRGRALVGCEIPVILKPNEDYKDVIYKGFLDVVLYDEKENRFKIIDLKTSTHGWPSMVKKDEKKQNQLILYKKFFSDQYGVPIDNIDIEFIILRRKLYEDTEFPIKRIQLFSPASGRIKVKKAMNTINSFIEDVFDGNQYKEKEYEATPSKWTCNFCPFKDNKEICNKAYHEDN